MSYLLGGVDMIEVLIKENGESKGIILKGHANYAEHGKDIVCASVSTIFQLMAMGLRTLARQYPEYIKITEVDINEQDARI